MNKKTISLFSFFLFLFMAITLASAEPTYWNESVDGIANNTEYCVDVTDYPSNYSFSVNWTDNVLVGITYTCNLTAANINFESNFNGSTVNVTPGNNTANSNCTWFVNYTFPTNITAGTAFTYKWYAKNDTGTENSTTATTFYIAKNTTVPVTMNLTVYAIGGTQYNYTDSNAASVQGQGSPYVDCWMGDAAGEDNTKWGTTSAYRNETAWTKGLTGATSLAVAGYTVKCNSTGNANYTNNATGRSHTLTISASGGSGGGGGGEPLPTTTTPWIIQPPEGGWELPEMSQNTIIILVIIGIVILASRKKK